MKFTDFLFNEYKDNKLPIVIVSDNGNEIENFFILDLEQYVNKVTSEDTNVYFKYLDDFFMKIPSECWKDIIVELLPMIDTLMRQKDTELFNDSTKHLRSRKANVLKKVDINTLQKALPIIEKFFECGLTDGTIFKKIEDIPNDIDVPLRYYNGIITLETIASLINDIKNGDYDQGFYYEQRGAKKEDLKKYLSTLNQKYNAKGSSDIKKFIDNFTPLQYANATSN